MEQLSTKDTPIKPVSDKSAQENLKNPPYGDLAEASTTSAKDERWQNSAEIASHVQSSPSDEYDINRRSCGPSDRPSSSDGTPTRLETMQRRTDSEDKAYENRESKAGPTSKHVLLVEDNIINVRFLLLCFIPLLTSSSNVSCAEGLNRKASK